MNYEAAEPVPQASWWRTWFAATVDYRAVVERVHEDAALSGHFLFMTIMSAGIAMLGLLLSSPAVVIGAMLISPLMGPIIGLGFGIAVFDLADIRASFTTFATGVVLAVLFAALIVLLSPIQEVTTEIAARTRPNLFDLGVAVLSGLAGTYAMIRGRHGAIVGVAIAVALMPPLAVVGFGLATLNMNIFSGAAFLFFTNLMAISLSAAALALFYGFGHRLSPRQTWLQAVLIVGLLTALAVPLGIALRQIAWEAIAIREARAILNRQFGDNARIAQVSLDPVANRLGVTATIFTARQRPGAEQAASEALSLALGRDVEMHLEQVKVGMDAIDAAQLAAARNAAARPDRGSSAPERLALVAGVPAAQVLVDPDSRIAQVRADELPGADAAAYRMLEQRAAGDSRDWTVRLIPPVTAALPEIQADAELGSPAMIEAVQTVVWAAQRLEMPVAVSGANRDAIVEQLAQAGVAAETGSSGGPTRFEWRLP